jgi:hypothetical protein
VVDILGKCQCGRVAVTFTTANAALLQTRACQCSFCRRHGAHTVSDPAGQVVFQAERGVIHRHQFGMRSADFLICSDCGVYVGVVARIDGADYAAVNAVGVDFAEIAARQPVKVNLDQETRPERDARRKRLWSPAKVIESAPVGAG